MAHTFLPFGRILPSLVILDLVPEWDDEEYLPVREMIDHPIEEPTLVFQTTDGTIRDIAAAAKDAGVGSELGDVGSMAFGGLDEIHIRNIDRLDFEKKLLEKGN
ncbi:uncharacterized protein DNG_08187 [Cephalotrichum gorgonifer]|uniref:Uncharacterized protein n=1 Tax=Cephalotrichum gorgonifer TaxID=2041049 RepID=A0AAE8N626_9PEZI|nr:uncharacterized protein DNG_08187 [Cephalotrichum gorgonifer]